eukprot:GHVS01047015.1.p1 GENE.GHVS01047015.1~~GHVS01047015.1.p1  ORF type:complete len:132 (+),score=4.91 GHVS01047015.1:374-769(+)
MKTFMQGTENGYKTYLQTDRNALRPMLIRDENKTLVIVSSSEKPVPRNKLIKKTMYEPVLVHANQFMPISSCQSVHANQFMPISSCQSVHANQCTGNSAHCCLLCTKRCLLKIRGNKASSWFQQRRHICSD